MKHLFMKRTEYLIVGNSTAAAGAIEGIRKLDANSPVALISREPYHVYSRPLLSYLLAGDFDEERMYLRPRDFYDRNRVQARLGVSVYRIDTRKRVAYAGDEEIAFHNMLIATGGRPAVPPIEGLDAEGVFTFASWDDARAIDGHIRRLESDNGAAEALIIGAGMIGVKALEALLARSVKATVVERENGILPLALNRQASSIIERAAKDAGAEVICGVVVRRIAKDASGRVSGAILSDGRMVSCGLVVVAAGVEPETGLVRDTEVLTDRGILIDERCRTSVEGIYAAGDVAQVEDALSGVSRPMPLFPNAFRQGRIAGINMAGGQAVTGGLFAMNSMVLFGVPLISVGQVNASGKPYCILEKNDPAGGSYKCVVLKENRVVGALFVGDVERIGIFTGLIRRHVDVSKIRDLLLTDGFGLLGLPAEYRKDVVGGEGTEAHT